MKIDVQVCGGPWGLEQSCTPRDVPEATTDGENKLSRPTTGTGQLGQWDGGGTDMNTEKQEKRGAIECLFLFALSFEFLHIEIQIVSIVPVARLFSIR